MWYNSFAPQLEVFIRISSVRAINLQSEQKVNEELSRGDLAAFLPCFRLSDVTWAVASPWVHFPTDRHRTEHSPDRPMTAGRLSFLHTRRRM